MTAHVSWHRLPFFSLPAQIAAFLVVAMGGLVLTGWLLDLATLRSVISGLTPMNPTTAFTFVLAGLSLGALQFQPSRPWMRLAGQAGAGLVALIGGVKLGEYLFGWDVGTDLFLFGGRLSIVDAGLPVRVRMAPNTALNFALLGVALLLADRPGRAGRWGAQSATLIPLFTSFFALIGYAYDVKPFYSVPAYIPMAFHTALTFMVLGIGVLLWHPDFGVTAIVASEHLGGVLTRRLLPLVVLFPIVLGWLRLQGERSGLFGDEFGIALFAIIMVIISALLLLWSGWSLNRSDIERQRAEEAHQASEERFRQIAEHVQDVFWIVTIDFHEMLYVSPAYETIWGRSCESLYKRPLDWIDAIHPEEREIVADKFERALHREGDFDVEYRIVRPDGSIRHIHDRGFPVRNTEGRIYRIAGIASDITEQKSLETRLQKMAHHDPLTGLPNRALFYDRLTQALVRAKRNAQRVAVLYYDVDQFKRINDLHGHEVGDLLLRAVSDRLTATVREADTLSRLGGDEFAIILSDISAVGDAPKVAGKILAELAAPFHVKDRLLLITVSIGISLYPKDGADPDELVKHADAAMYRAKEQGRNNYQLYSDMS